MFTGIVDHCGTIKSSTTLETGISLNILSDFTDVILGESISVSGVCLTVTHFKAGVFTVALSLETLTVSNASAWCEGQFVNLERALRPTDRFGGHFVSGHVDATAHVAGLIQDNGFCTLEIRGVSAEAAAYLAPKGSICVDGVSLTVNQVDPAGFCVQLIPHTLQHTTLQYLKVGDPINLEYDLLAKLVQNQRRGI